MEIRPGFYGLEEVVGRIRYDLQCVSVLGRCYVGTLSDKARTAVEKWCGGSGPVQINLRGLTNKISRASCECPRPKRNKERGTHLTKDNASLILHGAGSLVWVFRQNSRLSSANTPVPTTSAHNSKTCLMPSKMMPLP